MTDSGGMFSKLINPNTAKPADSHKLESSPDAPLTPLPAKSKQIQKNQTAKQNQSISRLVNRLIS
jgi:hypothetical protein